MVIVTVIYRLKPHTRPDFEKRLRDEEIIEETRKEKGNLQYDYFYVPDDEDAIFLFELWESKDVFSAHQNTPHVARLQKIKAEFVTAMEPVRYEGTTW